MRHIEFVDADYFARYHHRVEPQLSLRGFIINYWETDFESLWETHPDGYTDVLFPDIGYTYLINIGTPFLIRFPGRCFRMKIDCFLPRNLPLECRHQPGNKIFGIKFKLSPHIFEKRINFSEYNDGMYSLSYLIDRAIVERIKSASSFQQRVDIVNRFYHNLVMQHRDELHYVNTVSRILEEFTDPAGGFKRIEAICRRHRIDPRRLQRYFRQTMGTSPKKAMQLIRIRKLLRQLCTDPAAVRLADHGYYDYSHFYKDLKKFMTVIDPALSRAYLQILERITDGFDHVRGTAVKQR